MTRRAATRSIGFGTSSVSPNLPTPSAADHDSTRFCFGEMLNADFSVPRRCTEWLYAYLSHVAPDAALVDCWTDAVRGLRPRRRH
ncbi:hypothetical protein ACFQZZ_19870 [Nocardia sp. GCM10030253]|uniref:hypothetical protein n=1 Tax=Nocardia sp. GCM10030253 TaxID=3273404 RepID=UPI00362711B1